MVVNPAVFLSHLAPGSTSASFYKSKPSEHLDGREAVVQAGKILGGGSSINFMIYTRAQEVDYNSWKTPGWTQQDLLPLLRKLETFHPDYEGFDANIHGMQYRSCLEFDE
jgi:alcohol oxidase